VPLPHCQVMQTLAAAIRTFFLRQSSKVQDHFGACRLYLPRRESACAREANPVFPRRCGVHNLFLPAGRGRKLCYSCGEVAMMYVNPSASFGPRLR